MVDVEKTDSNKTPLALAALMFFSPFIQHGLTSGSFSMNEQEKDFVSGYVKLGYLNLLFLLIAVGTGVGNYLANSHLLEIISTISIGILLIFILIGTICILANISLHIQKSVQIDYYDIGDNRQHVILKYLPLYNVYLRYKLHAFGAPNRWLKESLLRWTIAIVLMFTTSPYLVGTRIVLLILRVATLMGGIDFLHIEAKKQINYLFEKNPEELR